MNGTTAITATTARSRYRLFHTARRRGAAGPRAQRPKVLPHYPLICNFFWRSRFATRQQLFRRFFWHDFLRSRRTCDYQAAQLCRLGLLGRVPVAGASPASDPEVYVATRKGIQFVIDEQLRSGRETTWEAGEEHRQRGIALDTGLHETACTSFDIDVMLTCENSAGLELLGHERRYFRPAHRLAFSDFDGGGALEPDAGYVIKAGDSILFLLAEIDNGTESLPRIRQKIKTYQRWINSVEGKGHLATLARQYRSRYRHALLRLAWIVQDTRAHGAGADRRRLQNIFGLTREFPAAFRRLLFLATPGDVELHQDDRTPLLKPTFFCADEVGGTNAAADRRPLLRPAVV